MSGKPLPCPRCRTPLPLDCLGPGGPVLCPSCNTRLVLRDAAPDCLAWYFTHGNLERTGPFSWVQLKQLADRGLLSPAHMVWRSGMRRWARAGAVPGLFPVPPPPEFARPPVARETDVPPVADSASVLSDSAVRLHAEGSGPLSLHGMQARPRRSITLGDYQILKKLGAGAMGAVYLTRQRSANRLIALKVLSKLLVSQPAYVQRFFREAGVMNRLDHPNIVGFHGVGEEKGLHYFAMEFIDGFTLSALLQRRGGRLAVGDALHVTLQVARALGYAHERGVVHRDVKPSNVMVSRLGHVKITDMGLAKPVDEDLSLTASGTGVGTPQYMAPEQAQNAKHADHRSDIYALGGVFYQMLTSALPFQGESAIGLMMAKEQGQFPSARRLNRDVPDRLDLMIDRMLARDVRRRYQSCAEVIHDLESLGLAHAHLGFNPLHTVDPDPSVVRPVERVEILLIEDDADDILLAQESLEKNNVPSNLNVLGDPNDALAFLRRQGKYAAAPRPGLIILGRNLMERGGLELIAEIKADDAVYDIPLVVLTTAPDAVDLFEAHGIEVGLKFTRPGDLEQFQDFLSRQVEGSTVVVVQLAR